MNCSVTISINFWSNFYVFLFLCLIFLSGSNHELLPAAGGHKTASTCGTSAARSGNNLNINLPENNKAILRLEVELRDKHAPKYRRGGGVGRIGGRGIVGGAGARNLPQQVLDTRDFAVVPLEKVNCIQLDS